jgi:glycosyltransferase involved in cell wall biosynthesis
MKVLVATTVFAPRIGGMETVAALLARGFLAEGHRVTVVTSTPSPAPDDDSLRIVRNPSLVTMLRCMLETDVAVLMGPTLRLGWPFLFSNRSVMISHQGFLPTDRNPVVRWLRRQLLRRAKHVACSKAVASSLGLECLTTANPYQDHLFATQAAAERPGELAFLGRLVPEKGLDVLLDAMALLSTKRIAPRLKVIGEGPCRNDLEERVRKLGLADQVEFLGAIVGEPLVNILNRHKILVVPSSWNEPFGIVALEGIACGCMVIGSSGGGLPEAIGPCGITFANGDSSELANAIESVLSHPELLNAYRGPATEHLLRHAPLSVARKYIGHLIAAQ